MARFEGCYTHTPMLSNKFNFLVKWFLRKKNLKNTNTCSIYLNYLPLKEDIALQLNKFKFPPLNDALR